MSSDSPKEQQAQPRQTQPQRAEQQRPEPRPDAQAPARPGPPTATPGPTARPTSGAAARNEDRAATALFDGTSDWWDPQGSLRTLHDINPTRVAWIESRLGLLTGKRILDVGAGGGILAEALAERGATVLGIDTARQALQTAKLHALERGLKGVEYRCLTVEELAAEEGSEASFDAVVCMELLEHTPHPDSVVGACAALLRPGGDACFATINRTHSAYLQMILGAEHLLRLLPKGTHCYAGFVQPAELARWGRRSGLELMQVRGLGYNPLTRRASLKADTAVNYLAHLRRRPAEPPSESAELP
ncbi:bifunctional 3-demethylubiquinol 3-O-methyltransferase/2-polyprenyl-6-hydroxyphenol methylase [Halorhodospira abdelmalekii]|uniref:bifunctional 2-polyprenyl-6-hydroxyphenol methylase/3-demethylubiquinol 3-O-methyltransferase UbiG n=1 Tax=Halorhodospira abdelmalekii TaxID=421629 RepID=UPI001903B00F|nr:bifunctional 2-polyprenyl-6-hydroxyphenol methylase/3-demethylubiquinol 3-O-methyltransferase UbiG [Halorhodospira abdelmalekii]MBK1734526.1 bifunctional 3-demethylubiquinol 3-O-methyltransferase/2-polyprenyl-6-hydroxyphenol methylase [Halorhodospira abdelmalekii]